jgi:hypothetical protein
VSGNSGTILISGTFRSNGGTGVNGGDGGYIAVGCEAGCDLTISGTIESNGGNGATNGGDGGDFVTGPAAFGTVFGTITITGTGIIRCNGGSTNGAAGTILLDAVGTAGANVTQQTGSLLQTNNGAGAAVPANITID